MNLFEDFSIGKEGFEIQRKNRDVIELLKQCKCPCT